MIAASSTLDGHRLDREFEHEVTRLLRIRFTWLCALWLALIALQLTLSLAARFLLGGLASTSASANAQAQEALRLMFTPTFITVESVRVLALLTALWLVRRRARTQEDVLRIAYRLLLVAGLCTFARSIGVHFDRNTIDYADMDPLAWEIVSVATAHLFACFLLPWTPQQGIRPLLMLYPVWIAATLWLEGFSVAFVATGVLIAPSLASIGLTFCWWRHSRLRERVEVRHLRRQFTRSRRDLIDARNLHERRFPQPIADGPVRLSYSYEPMRQVGGDFLHAHLDAAGSLHVVLIDVTGHGIPAALAVNRIDGELARVFAENPAAPPREVLTLLNRYLHLTMARYSMYATAIALRLDCDGTLEWTNGGHPPAFIRRAGSPPSHIQATQPAASGVERLDSTTYMLGAVPDEIFDPGVRRDRLDRGDTLVLYTDGACEAVDRRGAQLGLPGIVRILASWRPEMSVGLIPFLPEAVRHHRAGAPQDDVLIAAVSRA